MRTIFQYLRFIAGIIVIILQTLGSKVFSQSLTLQQRYSIPGEDFFASITPSITDSNLIVAYGSEREGLRYNSRNGNNMLAYGSGLYKLSPITGDTLLKRTVVGKKGYFGFLHSLGSSYCGMFVQQVMNWDDNYVAYLALIDSSLNVTSYIDLRATLLPQLPSARFCSFPALYARGDSIYVTYDFEPSGTDLDVGVACLNSYGVVEWNLQFASPYWQTTSNIRPDTSGNLLVSGNIRRGVPWTISLDAAGNRLWEREIIQTRAGFANRSCLYRLPDGGYLGYGTTSDTVHLYALNSNFSIRWRQYYKYDIGFESFRPYTDGTFSMTKMEQQSSRYQFYLKKVRYSDGGTVWQQALYTNISDTTRATFNAWHFLEDGRAVVVGSIADRQRPLVRFGPSDFYFASWRDFGTPYIPGNGRDLMLSAKAKVSDAELHVWPNPARGHIEVYCSQAGQLSVVDMQGRRVYQVDAKPGDTKAIDISSLGRGIYLIKQNDKAKRLVLE